MPDGDRLSDLAFDFPEPPDAARKKALSLWATYYYVHSARASGTGPALLDRAGNELGPKLSERDFCLAAIEGTVRVLGADGGGTLYNYAGRGSTSQCDCSPYARNLSAAVKAALGRTRWEPSKGPFGTGVQGMMLVPFRSVAVDPKHIPYRSVIYIPQARGQQVMLPSGQAAQHDGYFYAADTGGAIKTNHIDVFSGVSSQNPFPNFIKSVASGTFAAYIVEDSAVATVLGALHGRS